MFERKLPAQGVMDIHASMQTTFFAAAEGMHTRPVSRGAD